MLGEMDDSEIEAFLQIETIGRIGCHCAGMTYVVPVSYFFAGDVYPATARRVERFG